MGHLVVVKNLSDAETTKVLQEEREREGQSANQSPSSLIP